MRRASASRATRVAAPRVRARGAPNAHRALTSARATIWTRPVSPHAASHSLDTLSLLAILANAMLTLTRSHPAHCTIASACSRSHSNPLPTPVRARTRCAHNPSAPSSTPTRVAPWAAASRAVPTAATLTPLASARRAARHVDNAGAPPRLVPILPLAHLSLMPIAGRPLLAWAVAVHFLRPRANIG